MMIPSAVWAIAIKGDRRNRIGSMVSSLSLRRDWKLQKATTAVKCATMSLTIISFSVRVSPSGQISVSMAANLSPTSRS